MVITAVDDEVAELPVRLRKPASRRSVAISTGPLEGTNHKIKTLQRTHYGFRDEQYFDLRLYNQHDSRYALIG
jgi:hypothetical protein